MFDAITESIFMGVRTSYCLKVCCFALCWEIRMETIRCICGEVVEVGCVWEHLRSRRHFGTAPEYSCGFCVYETNLAKEFAAHCLSSGHSPNTAAVFQVVYQRFTIFFIDVRLGSTHSVGKGIRIVQSDRGDHSSE